MLEAIRARTKLNIKGLTLESPVILPSNKPFDPRRDVTETDWQNILKGVKENEHSPLNAGVSLCKHMLTVFEAFILRPERKSELIPSDKILRQAVKAAKDSKYEGENGGIWDSYLTSLYAIRVLKPELTGARIPKKTWGEVLRQTENYAGREDWEAYVDERYALLVSYPDRLQEIVPNEVAWQGLKTYLAGPEDEDKKSNIDGTAYVASRMRMLNPSRTQEIAFTSEDWEYGLAKLHSYRDSRRTIWNFLPLATNLAIMAADSVYVTEQGIQLVNNPGFKEQSPIMPARRRF